MIGTLFLLASGAGCGLLKPKEKKPFGADCKNDLDCESLECSTYGSICTKSCTYDSECGGDLVCRDNDKGAGNLCAKAVGVAPNGACMNPPDCQHGHCLKKVGEQNEPGICSKFCQTPAECPDHMKICASISDSGLVKFCLPGEAGAAPTQKFAPPPPKKQVAVTTPTTTTTAAAVPTPVQPLGPPDAGAPVDAGKPADAGAPPADAGKVIKIVPPTTAPKPTPKPG